MKKFIVCFSAILIATAALLENTSAFERNELDEITGRTFLMIQATLPELARNKLDISNYVISVIEKDGIIVVVFKDPDQSPYAKGSVTRNVGFEVELRKEDNSVIRSYFSR